MKTILSLAVIILIAGITAYKMGCLEAIFQIYICGCIAAVLCVAIWICASLRSYKYRRIRENRQWQREIAAMQGKRVHKDILEEYEQEVFN